MKKLDFSNPKTILFLTILLVVIFFIAKYVYKNLKKSNSQKLLETVTEQIDNSKLTYNPAEYFIMADQMEVAMKGPGTNENLIKTVLLKLKTASDWYKLIEAFGNRQYGHWYTGGTEEGTLIKWLDDDLSVSNKSELNQILNKIGVKF